MSTKENKITRKSDAINDDDDIEMMDVDKNTSKTKIKTFFDKQEDIFKISFADRRDNQVYRHCFLYIDGAIKTHKNPYFKPKSTNYSETFHEEDDVTVYDFITAYNNNKLHFYTGPKPETNIYEQENKRQRTF